MQPGIRSRFARTEMSFDAKYQRRPGEKRLIWKERVPLPLEYANGGVSIGMPCFQDWRDRKGLETGTDQAA